VGLEQKLRVSDVVPYSLSSSSSFQQPLQQRELEPGLEHRQPAAPPEPEPPLVVDSLGGVGVVGVLLELQLELFVAVGSNPSPCEDVPFHIYNCRL
jgi:hypothetical protein